VQTDVEQEVFNQEVPEAGRIENITTYMIPAREITPGSFIAKLYVGDSLHALIKHDFDGTLTFSEHFGEKSPYIGTIDYSTGQVIVQWVQPPKTLTHMVVRYTFKPTRVKVPCAPVLQDLGIEDQMKRIGAHNLDVYCTDHLGEETRKTFEEFFWSRIKLGADEDWIIDIWNQKMPMQDCVFLRDALGRRI
jgi:hypothetical protein